MHIRRRWWRRNERTSSFVSEKSGWIENISDVIKSIKRKRNNNPKLVFSPALWQETIWRRACIDVVSYKYNDSSKEREKKIQDRRIDQMIPQAFVHCFLCNRLKKIGKRIWWTRFVYLCINCFIIIIRLPYSYYIDEVHCFCFPCLACDNDPVVNHLTYSLNAFSIESLFETNDLWMTSTYDRWHFLDCMYEGKKKNILWPDTYLNTGLLIMQKTSSRFIFWERIFLKEGFLFPCYIFN